MKDEEFEKYFERIEDIITYNKDIIGCGKAVAERANRARKQKEVKQILEEVWQSGYFEGFEKGLEKGTDMFSVELDR